MKNNRESNKFIITGFSNMISEIICSVGDTELEIDIVKQRINEPEPDELDNDFIKSNDLIDIYSKLIEIEFSWANMDKTIRGAVNIQSWCNFYTEGWEDMVDEIWGDLNCDINSFRVFDFYANQNYVGCFLNNYNELGLFYVRETTAYPLHITATSYMKLLEKSKGLNHWPSLLIKYNLNIEFTESKNIEKDLLKIFPEIDLEGLKNEYLSLRINQN